MPWNHCTKCRREFADAQELVEHRCDADAVRRKLMRRDVVAMADRANRALFTEWESMPTIQDLLKFDTECREFAKELAR